jgi:rhodanese-related sulfurtransferase
MVAACVSEDKYQNITVSDAKMMLENVSVSGENIFILDVRTPAEYSYSHIEGAKLIPLKNVPLHDPVNLSDDKLLPNRMTDLPEDKYTVVSLNYRTVPKKRVHPTHLMNIERHLRFRFSMIQTHDQIYKNNCLLPEWKKRCYRKPNDSRCWLQKSI